MISGAHAILYSTNANADRAFLRDVFGLPHVDAGEGWLIFGLPPSEVAVHPSEENDQHELYLIVDDIQVFTAEMGKRGIDCGPLQEMGWGILTQMRLPGGGKLGVYQPRHARPVSVRVPKARPKPRRAARKSAKRKAKAAKGPAKRVKTARRRRR